MGFLFVYRRLTLARFKGQGKGYAKLNGEYLESGER